MNRNQEARFNGVAPQCADEVCGKDPGYSPRKATLREEVEKSAAFHSEVAQKLSAASDFLRDHPEFEEFVRLIRLGAIQF